MSIINLIKKQFNKEINININPLSIVFTFKNGHTWTLNLIEINNYRLISDDKPFDTNVQIQNCLKII